MNVLWDSKFSLKEHILPVLVDCSLVVFALEYGPTGNDLVVDCGLPVKALGINDALIHGIGEVLALVGPLFIVLVMMFPCALNLQESLIASVSGPVYLQVDLVIELLLRIEHQDEHLLAGRCVGGQVERKVVAQKPANPINVLNLLLLSALSRLRITYY